MASVDNETVFPVFHALTNREEKEGADYGWLLSFFNIAASGLPEDIDVMTDFDEEQINGIKRALRDATIYGNRAHFVETILGGWKNSNKKSEKMLKELVEDILDLATLKDEPYERRLSEIETKYDSNKKVSRWLKEYFAETFATPDSTFPPSIWAYEDTFQISNPVELYHLKTDQYLKRPALTLKIFKKTLKYFDENWEMNADLERREQTTEREKRKKEEEKQEEITTLREPEKKKRKDCMPELRGRPPQIKMLESGYKKMSSF